MQHLRVLVSALLVAVGVFQVEGTETGEDTYTDLLEEERAYSKINVISLARSINFKDGVDILDTLAHIVVGLSRNPENGRIYKRMVNVFLEKLQEMKIAPNFLKAWKTICNIVDRDRKLWDQNEATQVGNLVADALMNFYKDDITDPIVDTFHAVVPFINNAIQGDAAAAAKIIGPLANQFPDFVQLTAIDHDARKEVLEAVTAKLHWLANEGLRPFIEVATRTS